VTHGWARTLPREIIDVTEELSTLPARGLLVTAVHREGRMQGTDLFLMEDVVDAASFPVFASGGIASTPTCARWLIAVVAAAIIGMALYTGALDRGKPRRNSANERHRTGDVGDPRQTRDRSRRRTRDDLDGLRFLDHMIDDARALLAPRSFAGGHRRPQASSH
jgi:hypothetical protein